MVIILWRCRILNKKEKLTYKDSGVDIEAGYKSVDMIKKHVKSTFTDGVLSDIGGFGGMFSLGKEKMEEPVLVSGTDGVGTKLMVAFKADKHDSIGQDAVAMCVNDVVCQGAKPLFFLDYIATGRVKPDKISSIPSSGLHSNGYSLVRKLFFEIKKWDIDKYIPQLKCTLGEELLKPTEIYVEVILKILEKYKIKGISHITGGGFYENIPRMLPENLSADIYVNKIKKHPIFNLIESEGSIEEKEMYSTFNMGIGMVLAANEEDKDGIMEIIKEKGNDHIRLGKVSKASYKVKLWKE